MRRLLVLFLLVLLPLQFSWAAAAAYCEHESGLAAQHIGHHAHQDAGASACTKAPDGDPSSKHSTVTDHDCGQCQGHHIAFAPAFATEQARGVSRQPVGVVGASPPSGLIDRPERPKWARPA